MMETDVQEDRQTGYIRILEKFIFQDEKNHKRISFSQCQSFIMIVLSKIEFDADHQ